MKHAIMKKIAIIASMLLLMGCNLLKTIGDPVGVSYFVWVNESDHEIALYGAANPYNENGPEKIAFNETLSPGEKLEWEYFGGIAKSPPPSLMGLWKLTVSFDDDIKVVYLKGFQHRYLEDPVGYDPKFSLINDGNYIFEKVKDYTARWTYTFTNADYEAAKALASQE